MDYKLISSNIRGDVNAGVYKNFPKLAEKLLHISKKLDKLSTITNANNLSYGEINTLKFQGYLDED